MSADEDGKARPVRPADERSAGKGPTPSGRRGDVAEAAAARMPEDRPTASRSSAADVAAFVAQMRTLARPETGGAGRGRLVFAMDATMSRQPTWDLALSLQADMFEAVADVGGLDVQLVYFRGNGECRASRWVGEPRDLARLMTSVSCRGGFTQIGKVLAHVRGESERGRVNALVYVGDCMEEDIDRLCHRAGELAMLAVPVFLFQEGRDQNAERGFREIARLTGGAYCRFDAGAASQLRDLLTAVAVYASGGRPALEALSDGTRGAGARRLLAQLPPARG